MVHSMKNFYELGKNNIIEMKVVPLLLFVIQCMLCIWSLNEKEITLYFTKMKLKIPDDI
jgi:hypothetical protein